IPRFPRSPARQVANRRQRRSPKLLEYLPGSCRSDAIGQDCCRGRHKEMQVGEWLGVLLAILSSLLGGTAAAVTRYLVGNADPITLAILRWGIGLLCLLPTALVLRVRWPARSDWVPVAALGICFFGLFFVLYNIAVSYTTAARASLALSTLPLQTMLIAALLGAEPLSLRKSAGVGVAMLGVFAALASGLSQAPAGAWRG